MRITFALMLLVSSIASATEKRFDATLAGYVGDVLVPDGIWIGAIEVRFRDVFVREDKKAEALRFMRALAMRREVECRLTGERLIRAGNPLVGHCLIFGPTDGREIDLGQRLLERGFARACKEPQATIAVWPPVYSCG